MKQDLFRLDGVMITRAYLSGPMTGFPDLNFPVFDHIAEEIVSQWNVEVINPAKTSSLTGATSDSPADWVMSIREDIQHVQSCDCVIQIDRGWINGDQRHSHGETIEAEVANRLGIPIYRYAIDGKIVPFGQDDVVGPVFGRIPVVVGLTGLAGSGKDTAGEYFVRHGLSRLSLGDYVRDMAEIVDPIVGPDGPLRLSEAVKHEGWTHLKRNSSEVRRLLQVIGTDAMQYLGDSFWHEAWVGRLIKQIREDNLSRVVVTDIRFDHEAERLEKQFGGNFVLLKIYRPKVEQMEHISEAGVSDRFIHETIVNDSDELELGRRCMSSAVRAMYA